MSVVEDRPKVEEIKVTDDASNIPAINIIFDNDSRTSKDGVIEISVEKGNFMASCPVDKKTIDTVFGYVKDYNMAVATASSELGLKEFKSDKDVTDVKVRSNMGTYKDNMVTAVKKNKDYPAMGDRPAFSQPAIRQTIRSYNFVNKTHLKNTVKSMMENL